MYTGTLVKIVAGDFSGRVGTITDKGVGPTGKGWSGLMLENGSRVRVWTVDLAPIYVDTRTIDETEADHYRRLGI